MEWPLNAAWKIPVSAIPPKMWTPKPEIYSGAEWQFAPVAPQGQLHFSTDQAQLFVSDGTQWTPIGMTKSSVALQPEHSVQYRCPFCSLTWVLHGESYFKGQGATLAVAVENVVQKQVEGLEEEFKMHLHQEHAELYKPPTVSESIYGAAQATQTFIDAMKKITTAMNHLGVSSADS